MQDADGKETKRVAAWQGARAWSGRGGDRNGRLIAFGDNDPRLEAEYRKLGTTAGAYDDWHEGRDPAGITTQNPVLAARLDPVKAGRRLSNYLSVLTLECQTIARSCGKSHIHNLIPETTGRT